MISGVVSRGGVSTLTEFVLSTGGWVMISGDEGAVVSTSGLAITGYVLSTGGLVMITSGVWASTGGELTVVLVMSTVGWVVISGVEAATVSTGGLVMITYGVCVSTGGEVLTTGGSVLISGVFFSTSSCAFLKASIAELRSDLVKPVSTGLETGTDLSTGG